MSSELNDLEAIRQTYSERLDILRQSRILYNKNKHRSVPSRGPYEYGLKVATEEFEAAKDALRTILSNKRQAEKLERLKHSTEQARAPEEVVVSDDTPAKKTRRVFLAKLQQAEALKKELSMH